MHSSRVPSSSSTLFHTSSNKCVMVRATSMPHNERCLTSSSSSVRRMPRLASRSSKHGMRKNINLTDKSASNYFRKRRVAGVSSVSSRTPFFRKLHELRCRSSLHRAVDHTSSSDSHSAAHLAVKYDYDASSCSDLFGLVIDNEYESMNNCSSYLANNGEASLAFLRDSSDEDEDEDLQDNAMLYPTTPVASTIA